VCYFTYVENFIHNYVHQSDRNRKERFTDKKMTQIQPAMGAVLPFVVPTQPQAVSCDFLLSFKPYLFSCNIGLKF
jgi:hypothetical protein